MKRIALLGFIIIGLPIIFGACKKDEYCDGYVGKLYLYTCSKIENSILKEDTLKYTENDTVSDDTIRFRIKFTISSYGKLENQLSANPYSAIAHCGDIALPANKIQSGIFLMQVGGITVNMDTVSGSAKLRQSLYFTKSFKLPLEYNKVWESITSGVYDDLTFSLPSPHNSKNIRFVSTLIKEKGDFLDATSVSVFCK